MEDLGDEELRRISTPTKSSAERPASAQAEPEPEAPRLRMASLDDSEALKRLKQDGADKGDDNECGRKMFDKRELRKRHKVIFDDQLSTWRDKHLHEMPGHCAGVEAAAASRVRVCVRKRPLFEYEREADEFDVVSIRAGQEVVVHNCLTKADLRSLFVAHLGFQFARVFCDKASDDEVYSRSTASAVEHVQRGGVSTLFMFGQTGSGKTHTMAGIMRRASLQLFREDPANTVLTVEAFEIAGRNMRDLLDSSSATQPKVMEDKDHKTRVVGIKAVDVSTADGLLETVQNAQAGRATRATQVNDTSSRSHAVFRIWRPDGAVLTLVDCAGSERREDTTNHDVQSRKDAAEINSTIFALKECFRVMRSSKGQQPNYRDSLLTRVLSDSFSSDSALIVAIGTVSPSATDTEHSLGTLRALQQLQGTSMAFESRDDVKTAKEVVAVHPRCWTEDEVKHWMHGAVGGKARALVPSLSKGTDGKNIVRWPVQRFNMFCNGDESLATELYQDLRLHIRAASGGGAGAGAGASA